MSMGRTGIMGGTFNPVHIAHISMAEAAYRQAKLDKVLFMPSKNFNESQFCLFEGGAAWATRAVGEYKILALNYEDIPTFLTNGKSEACLNIKTKHDVEMSQEKYNNIVKTLN